MPKIQISLAEPRLDEEMLERLHRRLRYSIEDAEIGDVQAVRAETAGEGTRSATGQVLIGVLTVLISSGVKEIAVRLAAAVGAFVRKSGSSVTVKVDGIELTIDKATADQSEELIKRFFKELDEK